MEQPPSTGAAGAGSRREGPRIIGPADGKAVDLGSFGVRFMVWVEDVVYAEKGRLVFKPRDQRHTFWNAGDEECRILEIISPGGFEHLFDEVSRSPESMTGEPPAEGLDVRYGLEVDYGSVARLCEEHGVAFPAEG